MSLTPAQQESVNSLLRILGGSALLGGAVRTGYGVLRNANRVYEPPAAPAPLIVDMPYAAREAPPVAEIPIPKKMQKAAWSWRGTWEDIKSIIPTSPPVGGFQDAQGPTEVPLHGFAAPATAAAGLGGGYMLADRLLRAADRRNARKDLEAAQAEYQQAVMNRVAGGQSAKVAADLTKMTADQTPDDPDLRRAKAALDELYARVKAANPGETNTAANAAKAFLYPLSLLGPEGFWLNMGLAGTGAALGGFAGYNAARDSEEASSVRSEIKALDKQNAKKIHPPVIARLVPVAPDKI
jgi:membrane protein YqaA with SNARE-associated domain